MSTVTLVKPKNAGSWWRMVQLTPSETSHRKSLPTARMRQFKSDVGEYGVVVITVRLAPCLLRMEINPSPTVISAWPAPADTLRYASAFPETLGATGTVVAMQSTVRPFA